MNSKIPKKMYKEGLMLCRDNAMHLFKGAEILYEQEKYLCSFLLGFASCEEYGKLLYLIDHWDEENISLKMWKKEFKDHFKKLAKASISGDRVKFERLTNRSVFAQLIKEGVVDVILDKEYIKEVHDMRTACLYVDFDFEKQEWKSAIQNFKKMQKYAFHVLAIAIEAYNALEKKWKELWETSRLN